jgi:hypothetical protein
MTTDHEADGTVGRGTVTITGHFDAGGGAAEIRFGVVYTRRGERLDRFEVYAPEAVDEQRARVRELLGGA